MNRRVRYFRLMSMRPPLRAFFTWQRKAGLGFELTSSFDFEFDLAWGREL